MVRAIRKTRDARMTKYVPKGLPRKRARDEEREGEGRGRGGGRKRAGNRRGREIDPRSQHGAKSALAAQLEYDHMCWFK